MFNLTIKFINNLKVVFFLSLVLVLTSCVQTPKYDVDDVINAIEIGFNNDNTEAFITEDVTLPTYLEVFKDASVRWESSHPDIVSIEGSVIRPEESQAVSLILNVRVGSTSKQKIFELFVVGTRIYTNYQVTYYIENLDDDAYEVDRMRTFQGYVGETISLEPEKVGFIINEELSVLEGIIVEDTFQLSVYFKREIYRINYFSQSELIGYQDIKYGAALENFVEFEREGYKLLGWSKEPQGEIYRPNEVINSGFDLYALWKEDLGYHPYYDDITETSGEALFLQLRALLNATIRPITYGVARDILQESDADPTVEGNIILVYTRTSVEGTWDRGVTWNREHVWPQSRLGSSANNDVANLASDIHNLKPANPVENSSRSNKYFANETTSLSYEPHDDVKGDVARILFYMITMYDYLELVNGAPTIYQMAMLNLLIEWHEQDPVDEFERNRNDVLYKYQKNRNPYIDHPEFVDLVIKPELANYKVNYYTENLEDEAYTFESSFTYEAILGKAVSLEPTRTGFTLDEELSFIEGVVTKSLLELNVYFKRETYKIEFYNGTELIGYEHVKFGGQLSSLPELVDDDTPFLGWSTSTKGTLFNINTTVTEAFTLYAQWQEPIVYLPYYDVLTGGTGEALLLELRTLINQNVTMQTYGDARDILQEADADPNVPGNIILIYRRTSIPSTWDSGATWNREHVWPQSLLGVSTNNSSRHVGADLHNLKPANPSENSSRGNKYFDNTTTTVSYAPHSDVKGDVARILLYMITMYEYLELINGTPTTYQMAMLDVLIEWHEQDPVDDFERNRNEVIFSYQGNRNPFIDHPEFVNQIWGDNNQMALEDEFIVISQTTFTSMVVNLEKSHYNRKYVLV